MNTANDNHYQFNLSQNLWTACSGQVDEDDGGVEITATYPIQQWLTNCSNQGALWQVKHGNWRPLRGLDALRVYQLAALIEVVPRISLNRCTVKMHQRPTLWPTQRMSHQDEHHGCHQNVTPWQFHGPGHGSPPVPKYVYSACYTDWVQTLVTTISCRLVQPNGSMTCAFAGGVTACVHNEGVDIFITLRWMTKMTRMTVREPE